MTLIRVLALVVVAMFSASAVHAEVQWTAYSQETFSEAQSTGAIIVVDVHADWCPTCRAQQPILNELRSDPGLQDAMFVKVNFDRDKDFRRAHRIPRQSTILVFKGDEEVGRSVAETNRDRLRAFVLASAGS